MSRFLLIDIGAGTMDILCYDDQSIHHYKAVVKSPVRQVAEQIEKIPGNLVVTGKEMGGGPVTAVLKERARAAQVLMTSSAAATIHHHPDRVLSMGIRIISDSDAVRYKGDPAFNHIMLGDLQSDRIRSIVTGFGVPFSFDAVGICAQDHGVPPEGVSHLDYRHHLYREKLDVNPQLQTVLYRSDQIPPTLNRLTSIATDAKALSAGEIYVMDSGMAAILGGSLDIQTRGKKNIIILDIATSHTVGAAVSGGQLAGFFEYHTQDITPNRLETLIRQLADGRLSHDQVLKEGGHGAYIRKAIDFSSVEMILATGPKRQLLEGTRLPVAWGAPFGDNMMTGTFGLLAAIQINSGNQ